MPADSFASIMVQPPVIRCIGVEMRPFSLGHHLLLEHERSPFVIGGSFPSYADLIAAAFTCAHTWEENLALRRSPRRMKLRAWVWGRLAGNFDVAVEILHINQYIRDAEIIPEQRKSKPGTSRYLFSDWPTRLLAHLLSLGYSESEALNLPLAQANRLFVAHLEVNGMADFVSERDDPITRALTKCLIENGEEIELSA